MFVFFLPASNFWFWNYEYDLFDRFYMLKIWERQKLKGRRKKMERDEMEMVKGESWQIIKICGTHLFLTIHPSFSYFFITTTPSFSSVPHFHPSVCGHEGIGTCLICWKYTETTSIWHSFLLPRLFSLSMFLLLK